MRRVCGGGSNGGREAGMRGRAMVVLGMLLLSSCLGAAQTGDLAVRGAYWAAGLASMLPAASIPSNLFTHLFYAFVGFDSATYQVIPDAGDAVLSTFSATVKASHPSVKTLLSIGGAGSDVQGFAIMTATPALRAIFTNSSIALAREYGFDGLDLDYEFPASVEDTINLGFFLQEWRKGVEAEAAATNRTPLLLTAAVYYSSSLLLSSGATYPVASMSKNLDFVNLMEYDLHGSWNKTEANYNAPLHGTGVLSVDCGVQSWLRSGLPASKAVLGLPAYGYSWILANVSSSSVGSAAIGLGPAQNLSKAAGLFLYREVVAFTKKPGVKTVYDSLNVSSYAYDASGLWVGYDDPRSVSTKVLYAKSQQMRGYFFWAVNYDDSNWSLSTAAFSGIEGQAAAPSTASSAKRQGSVSLVAVGAILCALCTCLPGHTM